MNNDQYDTTVEHRGRLYRYDPDYDCFYSVDRYKDLTPWEAWAPLIVMLILCAIAVWAEYFR